MSPKETDEEIDEMAEGLTSLDAWVRGWRPTPGVPPEVDLRDFWRKYRREVVAEEQK